MAPQEARGRPFRKGRSGNPAGRPRAFRNRKTLLLRHLPDDAAEALVRKVLDRRLAHIFVYAARYPAAGRRRVAIGLARRYFLFLRLSAWKAAWNIRFRVISG
jgi:hypothetical protein